MVNDIRSWVTETSHPVKRFIRGAIVAFYTALAAALAAGIIWWYYLNPDWILSSAAFIGLAMLFGVVGWALEADDEVNEEQP